MVIPARNDLQEEVYLILVRWEPDKNQIKAKSSKQLFIIFNIDFFSLKNTAWLIQTFVRLSEKEYCFPNEHVDEGPSQKLSVRQG